jgi:predicted HTH domain antitoxin
MAVGDVFWAGWGVDQLRKLQRTHPDLVERVFSRLMKEDEELRWAMVISAYQDEQINLGRAAALLGMHRLELQDRLKQLGIPIRQGASDLVEAKAEADALRSWLEGNERAS